MKAEDIDLSTFDLTEIRKLSRRVRKEMIRQNRLDSYKNYYKEGDWIKTRVITNSKYNFSTHTFDLKKGTQEVVGEITRAQIQKDGRIRRYNVDLVIGDELRTRSVGVKQVETPTAEEIRAAKLIRDVKNG